MNPERLQRLLDRVSEVRTTDELFDLELRLGPFDEDDVLAARGLFQIAAARCQLSRGPAPSPERFTLARAAPAHARERFEVRGRIGTRIARVGWADGQLFGSLYAISRLERRGACLADARMARERILSAFDVVLDEVCVRAVA